MESDIQNRDDVILDGPENREEIMARLEKKYKEEQKKLQKPSGQ